LKLKRVILETDSMSVVSKLVSEVQDRSVHGPLVEEIKQSLRELEGYSVKWARRTANGVAHILAKEGCGLEICKSWFLVYPDCIANVLMQDLSGI
jgi:hypothetical protein